MKIGSQWTLFVSLALGLVIGGAFVFWLSFILSGDWEEMADSDIKNLEMFCQESFAKYAKRKYELDEIEIFCSYVDKDIDFAFSNYTFQVYQNLNIDVIRPGPSAYPFRDDSYFLNPKNVFVYKLENGSLSQIDHIQNSID